MNHSSGFTLIELLVVVAIIGILASLLIPSLIGAQKEAEIRKCQNRLRQMGNYLKLYQTGVAPNIYPPLQATTPSVNNWGDFLRKVQIGGDEWKPLQDRLYICPLRSVPPGPDKNTYAWADENSGCFPTGTINSAMDPSTPIAGDIQENIKSGINNHGDANDSENILLLDGSVQKTTPGSDFWAKAFIDKCLKPAN